MKKLLFFLLTFSVLLAHGQLPVVQRSPASVVPLDQHLFVKSFKLPVYVDTAHALAASGIDSIGLIFKEYGTSTIWQRDTVLTGGHHWTITNGGGGGGSFDSTALDIHSTGFNKTVFVQRKDSAANQSFGYVTQASRKKLADSLAALVGSGGYDSAASQGGGFHTDGFNVGKYVQRKDSAANEAFGYVTQASRQKLSDSLQAVSAAALALKKNISDSLANQTFGYVTQASRQKLSDSLQAIDAAARALKKNIADSNANQSFGYVTQASRQKLADSLLLVLVHRWDTAAGNPGSYVTWASRKKLIDSLTGIFDTTKIRYYGTGDTTLRAGGLQLLSALVRDSGNVHIVVNADSSLTFYGSGGAGTDSGFNVLRASLAAQGVPILKGTSGALRNILWDTLANNPAAIVTQASRKKLADSLASLIVGGGGGAYYPPLDSVLWKGPISARNMQVAGIKSTGQDTLTATTYSEVYDRVVVQDTATGAGNGKLYHRKMQTIDMTGAADGKVPTYQSSSLSFVLTTPSGSGNIMNVRRDTITNGSTIIPINPDPDNTGWINLRTQRNTQSYIARLFDTTVNSTTQFRLMIGMNSMGEHPDLVHQNFVKVMSPRGRSAGPGYISPGNNHTFATVSGGTTSWTERNILSGTPGKGIDGYDAITTGTGTDSIIISFGTQNKGFDHTWADTVAVFWYGQTGGGTFKVDIDGIGGGSYVTINTSSASGPQQTKIATTTGLSHTVAIIPVSEGTTHSIWCGVNEYRKVGGWIFEHVAKGASVVTDWTTLNAADWQKWVGFIKPTAFWMDWVVTSAGVMDSLAYTNGLRTMAARVHAVDSTVDIVAYGSTPLSITTTGATAFNNLPSYNRATKRLCIDSGWAYWDPSCIYGKTIFSSAFRGTQSSDSIHRTSSGSYAEVCMQMAGLGMLPMYLPPTQATIYNSDNTVLSPRTLNFNKQFLHLDSLTFLRFGGSTGNPVWSMDFTNSLALALSTGGVKVTTDFPLVSSQPITSNYSGTTIGNFNASLPNTNGAAAFITSAGGTSCTSCYLMYGQATAGSWILNLENLNAGAGYAIMQAKTGGTGNPVSQYVTGGTTWDAGADHSASNAFKIGTGGATFPNLAMMIPTSLNILVGTPTDVASSRLTVVTTTQGTIPMPSMTTTQRNAISSPATGLMVYDNTLNIPYYYNGTAWTAYGTGGGGSNYQTVQNAGSGLTQRPNLNFLNAATVADNSGNTSTDITTKTLDNSDVTLAANRTITVPASTTLSIAGGGSSSAVNINPTNLNLGSAGSSTFTNIVGVLKMASGTFDNETGTSGVTLPSNYNTYLINPPSTISSTTFTLPSGGSVSDGFICYILFGGSVSSGAVVTALAIGGGGTTILGTGPITANAGDVFIYEFRTVPSVGNFWFKIK